MKTTLMILGALLVMATGLGIRYQKFLPFRTQVAAAPVAEPLATKSEVETLRGQITELQRQLKALQNAPKTAPATIVASAPAKLDTEPRKHEVTSDDGEGLPKFVRADGMKPGTQSSKWLAAYRHHNRALVAANLKLHETNPKIDAYTIFAGKTIFLPSLAEVDEIKKMGNGTKVAAL